MVHAGQIVARMFIRALENQLAQASSSVQQADHNLAAARAVLDQERTVLVLAAAGTLHRSPPGRHQQARILGRKAERMCQWRYPARRYSHCTRARPSAGSITLRGVCVKSWCSKPSTYPQTPGTGIGSSGGMGQACSTQSGCESQLPSAQHMKKSSHVLTPSWRSRIKQHDRCPVRAAVQPSPRSR